MKQETIDHYVTYKPRPFLREERDDVTILYGGLHWRVERLIQGALARLGYKTRVLPTATREDLLTGRGVADIGQCCPTSFTTGNLANYLKEQAKKSSPAEVNEKFVYFTAGSCGACRFGQYHQSYELALKNIGMESFRMFLLAQDNLDQGEHDGGGLDLNVPFTMGAFWSVILGDLIQDLEYQIRPYEVHPGETEKAVRESIEYLHEIMLKAPVRGGEKWTSGLWYLGTNYFVNALREVYDRFAGIEVDRLQVKPVVKITGEFYLQTVEGDPNHNIHRWLESEGAEVYPAAITVWFDYLLRIAGQDFQDRFGIEKNARLKYAGIVAAQKLLNWTYRRMGRALGNVPHQMPPQKVLRSLAKPWFHSRMSGGEGDMLVGKALWAHLHKKAHMICELSPYSCMPNTMSVGAMAGVLGRYPDLLYAPLEIKGDAEVHALSRCQMVLTEARRRAQREFDEALEQSGLTLEQARERLAENPELSCAMRPVPRMGASGTAANLVLHLVNRRFREEAAAAPARPEAEEKKAASDFPVLVEARPAGIESAGKPVAEKA